MMHAPRKGSAGTHAFLLLHVTQHAARKRVVGADAAKRAAGAFVQLSRHVERVRGVRSGAVANSQPLNWILPDGNDDEAQLADDGALPAEAEAEQPLAPSFEEQARGVEVRVRNAVAAAAACITGVDTGGFEVLAAVYAELQRLIPHVEAVHDATARSMAAGFVAACLMGAAPFIVNMPAFVCAVDASQRAEAKALRHWTRVSP